MANTRSNKLVGRGEEIMSHAFESLSPSQWAAWVSGPLFGALMKGDPSLIVAMLMEEGAGGDHKAVFGEAEATLMHGAVVGGDAGMVEVLLEKNAKHDIGARTRGFNGAPLHMAAGMGHTSVAQTLLRHGEPER